jgi:ribose 5-phosphate isomerase RpiB
MLSIHEALEIVELWLKTEFQGGRHIARIKKIDT